MFHMKNSRSQSGWSDLPRELLSLIGKRFDTLIDILRFRSVCRSWRASLPKRKAISLLPRLRFLSPNRIAHRGPNVGRQANEFLIRRIIYGFKPLQTWSYSPPIPECWLAKVETTKFGNMRFQHQLSEIYTEDIAIGKKVDEPRKELNLLDLQIHEVARSYSLEGILVGCSVCLVVKVIMSPYSVWTNRNTCTIVAIYDEGKLGFAKHRCENWTLIDDHDFDYDDLIVYKGQICAVNRRGTISWIDSSMKLVRFSQELPSGNQKHLVECGGELYVVERLTTEDCRSIIGFNVYKWIQRDGRWEEVRNLGDQTFVLGNDCCFSVAAPKFEGLKGNCIYFVPKLFRSYWSYNIFDLEEGQIEAVDSLGNVQISGPPPIWLDSKNWDEHC